MIEETFGPTLPVMRVDDAKEAIRLANEGPYGLQASVWTRDTEAGERLARRVEAGVCCVNDAQVNYVALELPMGGWKASGLGSRHGPDGIRKYARRQSLLITPGYAPSREAHMLPVLGRGHRADGRRRSAPWRRARCSRTRSAGRCRLLRHGGPVAGAAGGPDGVGDPDGFWARAASHLGVPEAIELALLQSGAPPEQIDGLAELLDSLAEEGMVAETPQEAREQIVHAFADSGPEALAGIDSLRGLTPVLYYGLPDLGTGRNPNWDAIGYPGPRASRPPSRSRSPSAVPRPGPTDDDRGRRVRGRLRRRRRRGRRRLSAAGKQVCVLEMGGYYNEADFDQLELSAYQRLYLLAGPSRPPRARSRSSPARRSAGGRSSTGRTACAPTPGCARSGRASTGSRGSTGPSSTATSTRSSRASTPTTPAAT